LREASLAIVLSLGLIPAATPDAAPAAKPAAATKTSASAYKPSAEILEVYKTKCAACHLADGNSPLPIMNFADGAWKHGSSLKEIEQVIAEGVPGTAMLPFKTQVTPAQVKELARYVRSFDKKPIAPAKGKATRPAAKPTTD
jgi:cytochrome c oxidase cbb3-type subunit 3